MTITPYEVGQMLAGFTHAARFDAPASANAAVYSLVNQILKGQATMAIDLSKLAAELPQAIAALQQLPQVQAQLTAAQAANADLTAKLAAAPHDDPTVQATVDQMATSLQAALDQLNAVTTSTGSATAVGAAGVGSMAGAAGAGSATGVVGAAAPTDTTATTPPADTTATPAPVTTAPADPAAPTGSDTPI